MGFISLFLNWLKQFYIDFEIGFFQALVQMRRELKVCGFGCEDCIIKWGSDYIIVQIFIS